MELFQRIWEGPGGVLDAPDSTPFVPACSAFSLLHFLEFDVFPFVTRLWEQARFGLELAIFASPLGAGTIECGFQ